MPCDTVNSPAAGSQAASFHDRPCPARNRGQRQLIVVKVGTRVLTHTDGHLDPNSVKRLAEGIHALRCQGRRVVLVSSGAVGAGMSHLNLTKRPTDLAQLQAVAAVGQAKLIDAYDAHFSTHGVHAGQVLLTGDDLDDRTRYLNVRNTLLALLELNTVPVINENDTVAVDELMTTFGDNDRLAALVTNLLRAPLLVILSDVDGLYDRAPSDPDAKIIPTVRRVDSEVTAFVNDEGNKLSKGGMASKLEAARIATTAGENVIIASGHKTGILQDICRGEVVGTLFLAQGRSFSPWKRWIGFSAQTRGRFVLDDGAAHAVTSNGRSLLPIGIVRVEGQFEKGDVVSLRNTAGEEIARGLSNYSSREAAQIVGKQSSNIAEILGHCPYTEAIHRDNMVIL